MREAGKEHIPRYPGGWVVIRILQLIVAIIVLGLCCYLVTTNVIGAGFYVQIFTVRTHHTIHTGSPLAIILTCTCQSVCTLIVSIWLISAHTCAPRAFNYWAVLVLDIYLYLLWLGGFAASAILAAGLFSGRTLTHSSSSYFDRTRRSIYDFYDDDDYIYGHGRYSTTTAAIGAAAAGLGALEFLFFFICLVVDAVVIHKHRRAGLHSRASRTVGGAAVGGNVLMMPQQSTSYAAVPQQGVPYMQQETAYNPQQMYNAPVQQQQPSYGYAGQGYGQPPQQQQTGYYGQASPMMPQHTGASYPKAVSPAPQQPGMGYPPQ